MKVQSPEVKDKLDKKTVGAWLLHHDQKLSRAETTEFETIVAAGRSTRLLSVISRDAQTTISVERVTELARGIGIRKIELEGLLNLLHGHGLIEYGTSEIAVLGVSQSSLLDHAADIFDDQSPQEMERAVIHFSELASQAPLRRGDCTELLSDSFQMPTTDIDDMFLQSEQIGFVDYEKDGSEKLYFNGSLFRRENVVKSKLILDSLSSTERDLIMEAESNLRTHGCVISDDMRQLLGDSLWGKLVHIGYFDVSVVRNERGFTEFVSIPSALAKYIPTGFADMLDDAKALASSITYGITKSHHARGRIRDPSALMSALVNRGYVEGPVSAIKQDYRILERRGVVQVTTSSTGNRLTLLKAEVGEMASDLILKGDASETAAKMLIGEGVPWFQGPEATRVAERRKHVPETAAGLVRSLSILRKGQT